ncbi:MAG: serine/threonine protein kinase [Bdellovibrionales bacterium]|nr:serine/threonine protein kinase [Bdellovibrionales bacterium]
MHQGSLGPKPQFSVGDRIADRYEITGFLGKGGSGEVYRGKDLLAGFDVAVKVFPDGIRDDEVKSARLQREMQVASRVKSDYITELYNTIVLDQYIALVFEYIEGKPLSEIVKSPTLLSIYQVCTIARQIALGLWELHEKGIIHRDVKPENILFSRSGVAKLTDFGIALIPDQIDGEQQEERAGKRRRRATKTGGVVGTVHYVSPEYLSSGDCDHRSDIYALGLVMYELITGSFPFTYSSMNQLLKAKMHSTPPAPDSMRRDCPKWLGELTLSALSPRPEDRPATASEIADEIAKRILAGEIQNPANILQTSESPALEYNAGHKHDGLKLRRPALPEKRASVQARQEGSLETQRFFSHVLAGAGVMAVITVIGMSFFITDLRKPHNTRGPSWQILGSPYAIELPSVLQK